MCCIGFEIVLEMGFFRCIVGYSFVVSVEVGVIVNFEGWRVECSCDFFFFVVSSSLFVEVIEFYFCMDDVFERGCWVYCGKLMFYVGEFESVVMKYCVMLEGEEVGVEKVGWSLLVLEVMVGWW